MFKAKQEMLLYSQIYNFMTPIKFEQGKIEICLDKAGDRNASGQMAKKISEWTENRWIVSIVSENQKTKENITLAEEDKRDKQQKLANAVAHPILEQVLENFPGAKIINIQEIKQKTKEKGQKQ